MNKLYRERTAIDERLHAMSLGRISDYHVRPQDRAIRAEEVAGTMQLIEIFGHTPFKPTEKDPTELNRDLFFKKSDARPRFDCVDMPAFLERLNSSTNGLLSALRQAKGELSGCVLAGGIVTDALVGGGGRASDIDMFLTRCPPEEGLRRLQVVYEVVCRFAKTKSNNQAPIPVVMVTRTASSVTFFNSRFPKPPLQVVLHTYPDIAKLLGRFDVDSCCFAFDLCAEKLWCRNSVNACGYTFRLI